jgi:hypothetical protein
MSFCMPIVIWSYKYQQQNVGSSYSWCHNAILEQFHWEYVTHPPYNLDPGPCIQQCPSHRVIEEEF